MSRKQRRKPKTIIEGSGSGAREEALRTFSQFARTDIPAQALLEFFRTGDQSSLPSHKADSVIQTLAEIGGGERPNLGFTLVRQPLLSGDSESLRASFTAEDSPRKKGEQRRADHHLHGGTSWKPRFKEIAANQEMQVPASGYVPPEHA